MSDYRALVEQVQNRGGPLGVGEWNDRPAVFYTRNEPPGPMGDYILLNDVHFDGFTDILCGVLRRDLVKRGHWVGVEHHQSPDWSHEIEVDSGDGVAVHDDDMLTAFLRAWLEAVPEEPTRGP